MNFVQTVRVEQRRDKRLGRYILTLELDGHFYSTSDWSLGGFSIGGYKGTLTAGNIVPVTIVLETGQATYEQAVDICVVRNDEEQERLGARFSDLGSDAFDLLENWQSGRLQRLAAKKTA
jgi:hypothetical protein